ncbi:MAG TPA: ATP-binding protein [Tepidisphaeraceae bacterium]|jgi:DNA transposition AAA+ family ATPase|nr:ATP-binding protein [Tepidisphaeraceae bacterium]
MSDPQNNSDIPANPPDLQETHSPLPPAETGGARGETAQDREAMYRLIQNDRTNSEARMPIDQPSNNLPELIRRFQDRLERHRISLRVASRQMGYSVAVLSEFVKGKYKGDTEKVAATVGRWLNREAMRDEGRRPKGYVEMRISEEARSIVHLAYRHGAMATIIAPSGCGKTFLAKVLATELNGVYIAVNHTFTPLQFLMALAIELGWPANKRGNKAEIHRWIVASLKGTNRPLFIDEAHILGKAINFVRGVHDEAEVSIILIGTNEILDFIDDRGQGAGQFASRTIHYNAIEKSRGMSGPDDGAKAKAQCLFSFEEVKAFFAAREIHLDKEALMFACQLANLPGFGSLRMIERAAAVVFDLAPDTETVHRDQFIMALRLLHSSDFDRMERMVRQSAQETKAARVA